MERNFVAFDTDPLRKTSFSRVYEHSREIQFKPFQKLKNSMHV